MTCPGTPPRGNICVHTHWTFDTSGGARYEAREDEQRFVTLDHSIERAVQETAQGLIPTSDLHGIQMFEKGDGGQGHRFALDVYGGFGEWMIFASAGPPDWARDVTLSGGRGNFPIEGLAYGRLYDDDPADNNRPKESLGGASWRGAMVGREHGYLGADQVHGRSTVTYDFSDQTVDVELSEIVYTDTLQPAQEANVHWSDLPVLRDSSFFISGHGNHDSKQNPHRSRGYIDGDFYGTQGQEVAGVFETGRMVGAFGGVRDRN